MPGRDPELYKFRGKMLTMTQLAELSAWSKTQLRRRIKGEKMPIEKAVQPLKTDLPKKRPFMTKTYDYQGTPHTLKELSKAVGIPKTTLIYRLAKMPFDEAIKPGKIISPNAHWMTANTPDGPKRMTMKQWADHLGWDLGKISQRKTRKWTDDQALGFAPPPSRSRKTEH